MTDLETLVRFSNRYGSSTDYVIAGGGNTSCKDAEYLYVKGSGTALGTIDAGGFVRMDRAGLSAILRKSYSSDEKEREAQVLKDMLACCAPDEKRRPSVEAMLHNLFPQRFVLHLHPAMVNGLTCSRGYAERTPELFPDALCTRASKPGYVLAAYCAGELERYRERTGRDCSLLFLQNHGVFFASDTEAGLDALVSSVMDVLRASIGRFPDFSGADSDAAGVVATAKTLADIFGCRVRFAGGRDVLAYDPSTKAPTPDHIVYAKASMMVLAPGSSAGDAASAAAAFEAGNGYAPKAVYVPGLGIFALGADDREALIVRDIVCDMVKITVYAGSFGGYSPMSDELIAFIRNWEAESYRRKQV